MKPGVYDMPMQDYLAAPGVSQSLLKKIAKSPAHLEYARTHPSESTPDQILGTIFDTSVFEPAKLESCCHVKPENYQDIKTGDWKKWNGNAHACRDWIAARQDKPIIPQADFSAALMMRDAVFAHPAAAMALKTGAGKTLFCEDTETGLLLKARPDWLSGNVILDLKSCEDASEAGFAKAVARWGYHIQAAHYLNVCSILNLEKERFLFIACEKEPPYSVAVWELDEDSIETGRSTYRRLLSRYKECAETNSWPSYSRHVEKLSIPGWAKKAEWSALLLEDAPHVPALEVA